MRAPAALRRLVARGAPAKSLEAAWRLTARSVPGALRRGPAQGRRLWLTFDDGPATPTTEHVLEALAALDVRAVFCVVGALAERRPALLRRLVARGHAIVNHGHRHLAPGASARVCLQDAHRCQATLEDILGRPLERWYRPPYGALRPGAALALRRAGYRLLLWSVDPDDSNRRDPARLAAALEPARLRGGDVILLHDDYEWTAAALGEIVGRARRAGFHFAAPRELLGGDDAGTRAVPLRPRTAEPAAGR